MGAETFATFQKVCARSHFSFIFRLFCLSFFLLSFLPSFPYFFLANKMFVSSMYTYFVLFLSNQARFEGHKLNKAEKNAIAAALLKWSTDRGAVQYAHLFSPMRGPIQGLKKDGFVDLDFSDLVTSLYYCIILSST